MEGHLIMETVLDQQLSVVCCGCKHTIKSVKVLKSMKSMNSFGPIAPNPAINGITTLHGLPLNVKWKVRDLAGRMIQIGEGVSINFSGFSEGMFLIETEKWGTKKSALKLRF